MTITPDLLLELAREYGFSIKSEVQAALPPRLRELHRGVLRAFLDTGSAPSVARFHDLAVQLGADPNEAEVRLAADDLVHPTDGVVGVAYPFSASPTPHRVTLDTGPPVWAMCAIDALGVPLMAGRDGRIDSVDPQGGEPVVVERRGGEWHWEPSGAAVLIAGRSGCATAAEAMCRTTDFYASGAGAETALRADPTLEGLVVDQASAVEIAAIIFSPLLGGAAR